MISLHSWNVNGLRSVSGKGLEAYVASLAPDILCLQEIKIGADLADCLPSVGSFPYRVWNAADKPGYSGTAILSHIAPLNVVRDFAADATREGRVLAVEFPGIWVVCVYVPNSQRELLRLDHRLDWDKNFRSHLAELAKKKPVLVTGDFNCAHGEIDLANPKQNRRNAGFTDEERASFDRLIESGFEDTFRIQNPDTKGAYSWWTYRMDARARNIGWRLDYWLADKRLSGRWSTPAIHQEITGSDHCPVSVKLDSKLFA